MEAPLSSLRPSCRDGLIPCTEGVTAEFSEGVAADQVGLSVEDVARRSVRGEDPAVGEADREGGCARGYLLKPPRWHRFAFEWKTRGPLLEYGW
jgi:hypothetical protein